MKSNRLSMCVMASVAMVLVAIPSGRSMAQDESGGQGVASTILERLDAAFAWTPGLPVEDQQVEFIDLSTGSPTSWEWDFDDGLTSTAQNPLHTFLEPGEYEVTLTVWASGERDDEKNRVLVFTVIDQPTADFNFNPAVPAVDQELRFLDASVGLPTSWLWSFGDGETSTAQNPFHTYTAAGEFEVKLTVANSMGVDDARQQIVVSSVVDPPVAKISYSPEYPVVGQVVHFSGSSEGGPATSWDWDFGDGETSTEQNPIHTFDAAGPYMVILGVGNTADDDEEIDLVTVVEDGPRIEEVYFIPAASLAAGAEGSFFQTDVDINNWKDEAATLKFLWLPRGADNSLPTASEVFNLAGGASARYENVLAEVFGLEPDVNGALAIMSDSIELVIMARIYNSATAKAMGTFGQALPGVPSSGLIRNSEVGRITFMSQTADFRTNLGCVNGSNESLQVSIDLYDDEGLFLETKVMDLEAWSNKQINRIFDAYAPINGYAEVHSDQSGAAFYCYGSLLDNGSSDPTTIVPALK